MMPPCAVWWGGSRWGHPRGSDVLATRCLPALLLRGQHPDGLNGGGGAKLWLRLPSDLPLGHDAVDLCQQREEK